MRFFYKTKGAVSIFLVIILVPMLTVSSLFVDAGKVKIAKGVSESAGDLALNTALTDYDTVLKDMYGLFATSQDTKELFEKLEGYYRSCIVSSGVNDDDSDEYVKMIMESLGELSTEESTSDILNLQLAEFSVKKMEDANLSNPVLFKKQIIDFMKYRAPINTGLSFLSSLQSFVNLGKETELVDKRKDYYEAQQSVMENAQKAWEAFNNYNKNDFISDSNYFKNMKNDLDSYKNQYYQDIHKNTIKNLYDTQDYDEFTAKALIFKEEKVKYKDEEEISVIMLYTNNEETNRKLCYTELNNFSDANKASAKALENVLINVYNSYSNLIESKKDLLDSDDKTYGLQFIVKTNRSGVYDDYVKAVENYYLDYQRLLNAFEFKAEKTDDDKVEDTVAKLWGNVEKSYNGFKSDIDKQFNDFVEGFNENHKKINNELEKFRNTIGDKTSTDSTDKKIKEISEKIVSYKTTLENAKAKLEEAKEYLGYVLDGVKDGGTLDSKKNEWEKVANSSSLDNSSMAKQDRAELKDLGSQFKAEEVQKLITRCENIISGFDNLIKEIDKYKYGGKFLGDIKDYDSFKNILKSKYGDSKLKNIPYNENDLDNKIKEWWDNGVFTSGNVNVSWTSSQESQVNFRFEPKLNFYKYLYTHFHKSVFDPNAKEEDNESATKNQEQEDIYNDTKAALSEGAKDSADTSQTIKAENEIVGQSNLPSENFKSSTASTSKVETDNSKAAEDASKSLSSMFSSLAENIVDMGTDLRDNLYYADYVMSMFSYDTFEKEAKYNALSVDEKKNYTSVSSAETPKSVELLSLTKNPISKDKNYAYGGEVEYIIYGGKDQSNKTKAYGSIFAIRLGFNLVYAFTNSEIREGAFSIATPISAATLGIIPVPLIQAAIIVGIGVAESSIDLMCLREGMAVPLYKNKNTWNISFSNLISNLGSAVKNVIQPKVDAAIDTGVEYLDSWLDKTEDELNNLTNSEIERLGNSVEATFTTMVEREAGIVMQKVTTLVEIGVEEGLTTSDQIADYVSGALDEWLKNSGEDKDSLAYEVKENAIQVFKESSGSYIKQVYESIKSAAETATTDAIAKLNVNLSIVMGKVKIQVNNKISATLSSIKDEVSGAVSSGAAKLKKTINENVNKMFSDTSNSVETGGMSSMITFQYSDYLRLFLIIGMYTAESSVILRTADVVQVNMAQKLTEKEDYVLKSSAVYVEIDATVVVKPTLIGLPLFADVKDNPKDNSNWYTINYKNIKGY